MLAALLYLRIASFGNWIRSRARRLRQPKYLLGAIVGLAYFYFFFIRPLTLPPRPHARAPMPDFDPAAMLPADPLALATAAGALLLLAIGVLMWVVPTRRAVLGFSEAEIAFLFPAPVTRHALLHFRLLSAQFRALIGAAVMMLLSNRWSFLGGNALTHAIGWWFVFSALSLHHRGASFTLTRLADRGLATWRRRLLVLAAAVTVIALTFARLPEEARWPDATPAAGLQPLSNWLIAVTAQPPLGWVLWPIHAVLGPFLAADVPGFFHALVPALLVVTVHYLWVVKSAVAFEESSLEHAERRSARLAAWRAGGAVGTSAAGRSGPFVLRDAGRPELAFLWKNLLSAWPYFTPRVFAVCALVIAAAGWWLNSQPGTRGLLPAIGGVALAFAGYTLIVGPQFARQDLRSDLGRADILKTYPLSGWQIVLGEMLTPTAILTGVLWLALLILALSLPVGLRGAPWLTPGVRMTMTFAIAAVVPAMVALQLLVPTAAALFFPGWFHSTRFRAGGGPEVVGQRMIFFFAQSLTMVLALIPALLAAVLPFILATALGFRGPAAFAFAAVIASVFMLLVLLVEVAAGVWILGKRFERLDLSAELQP